jgi:hypothetical protein
MKKFTEYLTEVKKVKVGQGTLNIFDIDDTLFMPNAKTKVVKDGKIVGRLSSEQLKHYKTKPGERLDFGEFRSGKHFHDAAEPIEKMIRRAQLVVKHQGGNSRTIIVTARADLTDKDVFLKKFRDHGFPIDQVHVERSGNVFGGGNAAPLSKAVVIRKYINSGKFNKIRMWDDHEGNLSMLLKLAELHPEISFEAYLVNPKTGTPTRYGK